MLADKSISKIVYIFWEPKKKEKKKVSSLLVAFQTLQHKQPSLKSVSLKKHYQISP